MEAMNWREYIHSDPEILFGKPVFKGTRISVALVLERLSYGWTEGQLFDSYPHLPKETVRSALAYAAEALDSDVSYPLRPTAI